MTAEIVSRKKPSWQRLLCLGTIFNLKQVETMSLLLIIPLFLVILAVITEYGGVDLWLSAHFYDPQFHFWPLRNHWLTEGILHTGGQYLDKAAGLAWLVTFVSSFFNQHLKPFRKLLVFFLFSVAAGPILVWIVKHLTHIYTPWDLQLFHGNQPYIRLFDSVPSGASIGYAFPAGHASGGFAFMGLYFVFLHYKPAYRFHALCLGLFLGFLFGLGQQMRGAHFMSHDIFSLVTCWYASLGIYIIFYYSEQFERRRTK